MKFSYDRAQLRQSKTQDLASELAEKPQGTENSTSLVLVLSPGGTLEAGDSLLTPLP